MVVESKTVTVRGVSPQGDKSVIQSFDIPDGELYYVDKILVTATQSPGGSSDIFRFEIKSDSIDDSVNVGGGALSVNVGSPGNVGQTTNATLGDYATEDDKVVVGHSGSSDAGNFDISVRMRRVL